MSQAHDKQDSLQFAVTAHGEVRPIVEFAAVTRAYGARVALDDVHFELLPGELTFVVGPSGAGKTTLLKLINREIRPSSGRLWVAGMPAHQIKASRVAELRRRVGVVFQDYKLLPRLTARENVAFGLQVGDLRVSDEEARDRSLDALEAVGLGDRGDAYPHQLSGGQQQRVAVARAVVGQPQLLIAGLVGLTGFALHNLEQVESGQASLLHIYLRDDAKPPDIASLWRHLLSDARVAGVTYVNKDQALERAQRIPGLPQLADATESNPFPASLDVQVKKIDDVAAIDALVRYDVAVDPVYPTSYDKGAYQRIQAVLFGTAVAGFALLGLLGFVAVTVTMNSIKAAIHARRDEITIMQLVGAPRWMVRGPFVVEGAITGAVAGVVAGLVTFGLTFAGIAAASGAFTRVAPGVTVTVPAAAAAVALLARRIEARRTQLKQLARAAYAAPESALVILAESQSLGDLLTRISDLNVAGAQAAEIKESLKQDLEAQQRERVKQEAARAEQVKLRDQLNSDLSQLKTLQAQQEASLDQLQSKIDETRAELARLNYQSAQLAQAVTQMLQEQQDAIITATARPAWSRSANRSRKARPSGLKDRPETRRAPTSISSCGSTRARSTRRPTCLPAHRQPSGASRPRGLLQQQPHRDVEDIGMR